MAASDQIPGQEYEYVQIPIVRGDQDPQRTRWMIAFQCRAFLSDRWIGVKCSAEWRAVMRCCGQSGSPEPVGDTGRRVFFFFEVMIQAIGPVCVGKWC